MPQRLLLHCLSLSLAAAFGTGQAWGMGFARAQPSVTMGAPLDFVVGLRLDGGEVLMSECVSAEVWFGDNALAQAAVGASIEALGGTPSIRVRTHGRIDEPVVTVNVTAGCGAKIARRFTLFADPPGLGAALPAVVTPEPLPVTAVALPALPLERSPSELPVSTARATSSTPPSARPRSAAPAARAPSRIEPATALGTTPGRAKPLAPAPANRADARLRLDAPSVTLATSRAAIEAAERQRRDQETAVLQAAVEAAHAAASAASVRMASMEAAVEALKSDSKANRETITRLQQSLVAAEDRGRWTPWLIAAVLALLGVAGWLYARLKHSERERQQAWWNSSMAVEPPGIVASPVLAEATAPGPAAAAANSLPVVSDGPAVTGTAVEPMAAGPALPEGPLRDVSIEELLDVEQEAEFFVVLGQDQAAIDLLTAHVSNSGGASPLPYLKLLEIYHRRGDQTSYERLRRHFSGRFNAVAPDWTSDLQAGRTLEDYPEVVAQIQQSWPRPGDAMVRLETLLFRTDGSTLFDLPAYRDVLFLFALARDLQDMAQHGAPHVDVLLPLASVPADRVVPTVTDAMTQPAALSMTLLDVPALAPRGPTRPAALDEFEDERTHARAAQGLLT